MSFSRYVIEISEPVCVSALLSVSRSMTQSISHTQSDRFLPVGQLLDSVMDQFVS